MAVQSDDVHDLISTVQALSLARDLPTIQNLVKSAARRLAHADGATFVLKDGEYCRYADEDAVAPLWKGQRFPLDACISGWVIRNHEGTAVEDIYADGRIPQDAYRPTFVRSLAMLPIRRRDPLGAIGVYWAERYAATSGELHMLSALAESTAQAMEVAAVHEGRTQPVYVCAWTKQVKLHDRWVSLETFLKHYGVEISHGISDDGLRMVEQDRNGRGERRGN